MIFNTIETGNMTYDTASIHEKEHKFKVIKQFFRECTKYWAIYIGFEWNYRNKECQVIVKNYFQ